MCVKRFTLSQYGTSHNTQNYACFVRARDTTSNNVAPLSKSKNSYASQSCPANTKELPMHFLALPSDSKQLKNHGPQLRSKRTMEKKVIYCVPSFLAHIAQSNTSTCLYWRLSIVRILPKSTVHTKRATRGGTRDFQIIFQGKDLGNVPDKAI